MLGTLYAENPLDSIVSFREADYPDYVISLPEKRIDSVFYYANTSIYKPYTSQIKTGTDFIYKICYSKPPTYCS